MTGPPPDNDDDDDDDDMVQEKWFSDDVDLRFDKATAMAVAALIEKHGAKSVVVSPGIIGCPHEQRVDYEGEYCPECKYWIGRNRWSGEIEN